MLRTDATREIARCSDDAAPDATPRILVRVRDLHVRFPMRINLLGRVTKSVGAVQGVNLDIEEGTTLGLVGESGCGKTTLTRALLRLVDPSLVHGSVEFDGEDIFHLPRARLRRLRRDVQWVMQDPYAGLNPRMTVRQIIEEPLIIHRVGAPRERRRIAEELLVKVGLAAHHGDRYPHEFSGGQRQRIVIARAVALRPRFLICDEPVSALDVSIQAQILNLLMDLQDELRLTCLFVSHNLAVVRHVSRRVAVMYLGRIVEEAPVDELFDRPRHPYTVALLASVMSSNPDSRRERVTLEGEPPDPIDPPTGCAFHPRCPLAEERCRRDSPTLKEEPDLHPRHLVACHRAAEVPQQLSSLSIHGPTLV